MRPRELIFGAIAVALLATYLSFGSQLYASLGPTSSLPTPTPTAPRSELPVLRLQGTLSFVIQGDVYVMRDGKLRHETSEGRSQQPGLSADGSVLVFARRGEIDGQRLLGGGQVVNARLGYADVISKPSMGGPETVLLSGLRRRDARGFHDVSWYLSPALSPDGRRLAFIEDDGLGGADLVILDMATKRRTPLSQSANLADPSWSPDGRSIVTTTYNLDTPGFLIWNADRGTAQRLAGLPEGEAYRPSYSPDGRWLIYTLRHDGRNDLHAIEVATGRDVTITGDGRSWNGVFAPDGRSVAFLREQSGVIDVYAMELGDALTGGLPRAATKLTAGQGIDGASRPAWSR